MGKFDFVVCAPVAMLHEDGKRQRT